MRKNQFTWTLDFPIIFYLWHISQHNQTDPNSICYANPRYTKCLILIFRAGSFGQWCDQLLAHTKTKANEKALIKSSKSLSPITINWVSKSQSNPKVLLLFGEKVQNVFPRFGYLVQYVNCKYMSKHDVMIIQIQEPSQSLSRPKTIG